MKHIYIINRCIDNGRCDLKLIKDMPEDNEQYQKALDIVPVSTALFVLDNANSHISCLPRQ